MSLSLDDLQAVMHEIDDHVDEAITAVAPHRRILIPNALLNVAVERILAERGSDATVAVLRRLAELIADGRQPQCGQAIALTRADA